MAGAGPGPGPGPGGGKSPLDAELFKPLIFPNHPRTFKIFTYVISAAVLYYGVFVYKWSDDKRHCFSWIREYKEKKIKEIFHIDPSDPELQQHIREHSARSNANNHDDDDYNDKIK